MKMKMKMKTKKINRKKKEEDEDRAKVSPLLLLSHEISTQIDRSAMEEEEAGGGAAMAVVERLVKSVAEISAISDFGQAYKKELCNLSRRIKLLAPMFDELIDSKVPIPVDVLRSLASLQAALNSALDLLRFGSEGSKLFMVILDSLQFVTIFNFFSDIDRFFSVWVEERLDLFFWMVGEV